MCSNIVHMIIKDKIMAHFQLVFKKFLNTSMKMTKKDDYKSFQYKNQMKLRVSENPMNSIQKFIHVFTINLNSKPFMIIIITHPIFTGLLNDDESCQTIKIRMYFFSNPMICSLIKIFISK